MQYGIQRMKHILLTEQGQIEDLDYYLVLGSESRLIELEEIHL